MTKKGDKAVIASFSNFSSKLSRGQTICYAANGFLISLLPAYLFHFVLRFEATENYFVYAFAILVSSVGLFSAYVNVAASLKKGLYETRLQGKTYSPEAEKNTVQVVNFESVALSIFYNNALFLFLSVLLAFFLFKNWSPQPNYISTAVVATGLVALFSTSKNRD